MSNTPPIPPSTTTTATPEPDDFNHLTQVVFYYNEDLKKWGVVVRNARSEQDARDAFAAVLKTCGADIAEWQTQQIHAVVAPTKVEGNYILEPIATVILESMLRTPQPDPITLAKSIRHAIEKDGMTLQRMASALGMSVAMASNHLKLLNFPVEIQHVIEQGQITFTAARELYFWVPKERWHEYAEIARTTPTSEFLAMVLELHKPGHGPFNR